MAKQKSEALPHWDMTNVYPGLEEAQFEAALATFQAQIESLEAFLEEQGIRDGGQYPAELEALAGVMRGFIERMNACALLEDTIDAYLYSFVSTDSFNQTAKKKLSEHEIVTVRLRRAHICWIWPRL